MIQVYKRKDGFIDKLLKIGTSEFIIYRCNDMMSSMKITIKIVDLLDIYLDFLNGRHLLLRNDKSMQSE